MRAEHHPSIAADLAGFHPLHDFVLIRRVPDPTPGPIIAPQWKNPRPVVQRGEVIAVGPGDKITQCQFCRQDKQLPKCPWCSKIIRQGQRHEMYVKVGDVVLYHRAPANNVVINGEEMVLLHCEQHVLAVLDSTEEAA